MSVAEVKLGDSKAISKQLDYKPVDWSAPVYKFTKIYPQSGTQTLTLGQGSTGETIFELPTKCFNLSQSVLSWNETIPGQGAGNYSWKQMGTYGPIQQVQLYTRGGQMLCDMNYANVAMEVMRPRETKLQEFLTMEQPDALYPCNGLANVNYLPTQTAYAAGPPVVVPVNNAAITSAPVNYTERKYLEVSGNGLAATYNMKMRLSSLMNTIFAMDRDLAFPEVVVVRIVWGTTRIGWLSTSATNPTTGAAALTGNIVFDTIQLLLATETRPEIAQQVASVKEIMVHFTWVFKNNPGSAVRQTVTVRLNRMHGIYCKKIIHSLFNNTESTNTMYDHSNYGSALSSANLPGQAAKVNTYRTSLDNSYLQEYDLNCSPQYADDYMYMKKQLRGSVLQNNIMFAINWHHCDDFQGSQAASDGNVPSNYLGGLDLSIDRKWDFVASQTGYGVAAAYNHYTFVVCTRKLSIVPGAITIM
jgi:hypothetical protein